VLRIAWKSIASNTLRSLLTILGVIIGVAAVIIMVAVSAGTEATIAEQINSLGANLVFVTPNISGVSMGSARGGGGFNRMITLTFDDALAIEEQIDGIVGFSVEQSTSQLVKGEDVILEDIQILGTTIDFPSVREAPVADGRFFNEKEVERSSKVAVLGSSIAVELFGEADPIGQRITVGNTKLTVVGVMAPKGLVSGVDYDTRIYVPITLVFDKFLPSQFARMMGDSVRVIYVQAESQEVIDDVIFDIQLLLSNRHGTTLEEPDVSVQTQQDIIETQEATTESFRMLLGWVAGVSLLVGGIGIMNIMLVSVTERTKEIGIRQSLGATPNDIRSQFLVEALILSLVGGLIGVLSGVGGAWLFGETGGMRTVVLSESILLAFTSAALVGIFFGFFPANRAAQLDPIEALRHE
ncbi:MAG: ABC transporter permease, partial [Anaerolineaceae bacterium]|nr:ABC transporter permease [Anaerolineaceae bacterium]